MGFEQALQVIQWYCWRWRIERLFATLKRSGMDIESTQLESVESIQRLTILALSVSLKVLQWVIGREQLDLPAQVTFTEEEITCLTQLAPRLQGTTAQQQNPFPQTSLPWACWFIARLGGWSGYRSQRPPGTLTLVTGLRQFESIFLGWQMALH
jgi:hypothetical protein